MNGFFVFDRESGIGFTVSDKDIRTASGIIGTVIGAYATYSLVVLLIGLLLISPFLTVFALEHLFDTVVKNNAFFFAGLGILLLLIRLLWGNGSQNRMVRTVFFVYTLSLALYLLLEVLQLNAGVYTFFGLLNKYLPNNNFGQIVTHSEIESKIGDHWFSQVFFQGCDYFLTYVKWAFSQLNHIDHSVYSADLVDINILAALKTVFLDIAVGGFSLITVLAGFLVLFAVLVVAILLPFLLAFLITVTVNKGIYVFRSLQTRRYTTPNKEHASDPTLQNALRKEDTKTPDAQKEAVALYLQSAKRGNPYAQYLYADCLRQGQGITQNPKAAFAWYKKAASQGVCNAMYMTAVNYFKGYGTHRDLTLAKAWLTASLRHRDFFNFVQSHPMLKENADMIMKKCRFTDYI